jgi:hypothetical protein
VQSLRQRGYAIALDDFVPGSPAEALVPLARFVKLDVLTLKREDLLPTTKRLLAAGVTVVAEKVETAEVFERARAAGCSLFQGYYFCRPVTFSGRALPANHVTQMRLVAALNQPSVSLSAIEDLLKHDASLSYRVLRSVNSAGFGLRREIHSIREALRCSASTSAQVEFDLGARRPEQGPSELVTMTVIRAAAASSSAGRSIVPTTARPSCSGCVRCSTCCSAIRWRRSPANCRSIRRSTRASARATPRAARSTPSCTTSRAAGKKRAAIATSLGLDADALPDAYADASAGPEAHARRRVRRSGRAARHPPLSRQFAQIFGAWNFRAARMP